MISWGIIGLGSMANRFASAINEVENANLIGIASKSADKLKSFGDKYNINSKFRFNSYDDILNCSEINSIYLREQRPSPNRKLCCRLNFSI